MELFKTPNNIRHVRRSSGLSQQSFWSAVGVTQSGGSRYESGRNMPKPVRELVRIVHIEGVDLADIKRDTIELAEVIREEYPSVFEQCMKTVRAKRKGEAR